MREIKFRAWEGRRFTYFSLHQLMEKVTVCLESVQQFTGLKDKNGVEIYSGDILRGLYITKGRTDLVEEDTCGGWLPFSEQTNYDGRVYLEEYTCEVIGNIYENPELITK